MFNKAWHDIISVILYGEGSTYDSLEMWGQLSVSGIMFAGLIFLAILVYYFVHRVLVRLFKKLVTFTRNDWDDAFVSSTLFKWLSMLLPVVLFWHISPLIFEDSSKVSAVGSIIRVISEVLLILLTLFSINAILNTIDRVYHTYEVSRELPIKSFFQVIKIILLLVAIIFIIATVIGKSPLILFSSLGAMTAILILIFKDSLLGFVAGIQLSANKMVARGDWIEMPKFGADGEVMEVALTTVKVRNWDKTITTIPTYSLIADSFKNWRGMSHSGVRRIKRSLYLDMGTVAFLDDEMLERLKKVSLLKEYFEEKEKDIDQWNAERNASEDDLINARAMTNVGTFRAYVNEYLKSHPKISQMNTVLVRLQQASEHGLPLEIYVFTNDNNWVEYERIQSDIFDHFIAIMGEFGLRVFQSPSGADVASLSGKL